MKTLTDQLAQYAAYHRNPQNIATHFLGIPLIVAAVIVLLSRPTWAVSGVVLSPAIVAIAATLIYYFALDLSFGLIMTVLLGLGLWLGAWAATQTTTLWLALGIGGFLVGWVLQFIGHYYEGRKPAFVDDLIGLLIGPLFVVAEALFMLGFYKQLKSVIEGRVGTLHHGH